MAEKPKLKLVRAKRTGSYDGHRRRAGSEFPVRADARECWFEDVGPAPEDAELPSQIQNVQAPKRKSFTEVMAQQGRTDVEPSTPVPVTQSDEVPQGGEDLAN